MARYTLGPRIGAGGMAEVFRGTITGAEGFARDVAIKRVLPQLANANFATMFIREARIVSQLSHANICSVLDFDRDDDNQLFLAMELVDGKDLDAILERGNIPPAIAAFVIIEILRGLGHAHSRGVIHRDVSPRNVLVSWDGGVKVSDFGIAILRDATVSTTVRGKPGYMSPEQATGKQVDSRSDLFSVGIMLWELLTATPLFPGSTHEAIAQLLYRKIPRPSDLSPKAAPELEAIAMRLLARDREARYATTDEVIEDLTTSSVMVPDGRGVLMRWLAASFRGVVDTKAVTVPIAPRVAWFSRRRDRRRLGIIVVAASILGSAGAIAVEMSRDAPSMASSVSPVSVGLPVPTSAVTPPPVEPARAAPPPEPQPAKSMSTERAKPRRNSRPPVAPTTPNAEPSPAPVVPTTSLPPRAVPSPPPPPPSPARPFDPDDVLGD